MATKNSRSVPVGFHATTTPGSFVEVTAHLIERGTGKFYGLTFTPVKLRTSPLGFLCREFTCFSGKGLQVEPTARFNAARLKKIAALANTLPDYAAYVAAVVPAGQVLTGEVLDEKAAFAAAPVEA